MSMTRLTAAIAVLVAIAAATWLWSPGPEAGDEAPTDSGVAPAGARMTVHVTGEVANPGLVELTLGSRVADAVAAAGGTLPSADLAGLNLAAPLRDGEQVHIGATSAGAGGDGVVDDGRVHVNQATVDELEELPGVGPVLAQRIAAHRDQYGPFDAVEDMLDVPGIGEAKLAAMRDVVAIP